MWDQAKETLGVGKFNPMWHGSYVVKRVLEKGAYELVDSEGTALADLKMGSILKITMHDFQPRLTIVYYCTVLHR